MRLDIDTRSSNEKVLCSDSCAKHTRAPLLTGEVSSKQNSDGKDGGFCNSHQTTRVTQIKSQGEKNAHQIAGAGGQGRFTFA